MPGISTRRPPSATLPAMNTPLTRTELAHLDACLPNAITPSMLDDYLAAVASGTTTKDRLLHGGVFMKHLPQFVD